MNRKHNQYIILIAIGIILLFSIASSTENINSAQSNNQSVNSHTSKNSDTSDDPYLTFRVHNNGKISLAVRNNGKFGNGGRSFINPETEKPILSCEYPIGSGKEYLYEANLWVGGIIGKDTAISISGDAWFCNSGIFWPKPYPDGDMTVNYFSVGESKFKEIIAIYNDTLSASIEGPVTYDYQYCQISNLGLEVTQSSYSWADEQAEDFIIFKYSIKNIGGQYIQNGWAGILTDADIGHYSLGYSRTRDDIAGYLNGHKLAYTIDNNSDIVTDNTTDDTIRVRGAIGAKFLDIFPTPKTVNFNWYSPNSRDAEFGPRLLGTPDDPYWNYESGWISTPGSIKDIYYLLSHEETDYDQLWANINHDQDGWLPPPDYCGDIADGSDTKFLLSFGPFNLLPEDSIVFYYALIMGDNVHGTSNDFASYFNDQNPLTFFNKLDFSDLINNANTADAYYNQYLRSLTDVSENSNNQLPEIFYLANNYPNPFNSSTTIKYSLPSRSHVVLSIYNLLGQQIETLVNEVKLSGEYSVNWSGLDNKNNPVASGIYFYQLEINDYSETKRMLLLK